jgi:hypothetical protein
MSETPNGNQTSALAKMLSQLNVPTIAMILLAGGGNFFATQENGRLNQEEIEKAITEIHKIFLNQERREEAYRQIDESNRILKELRNRTNP